MNNVTMYTSSENQFYPTPEKLIHEMALNIDFKRVKSILEPSAGKGDILKGISANIKAVMKTPLIECIEIDPNLRAILKDKNYNVIWDDFLTFQTYSQYDLIIMNPPFKDGEKHLLKALDLCKTGGQICCILNAETLKNPCTVYRNDLLNRLQKYNAKIKYISGGFSAAERKTKVETAIIYVDIPKPKYTFDYFDKLVAGEDYESVYTEFSNTQLATNNIIDNVLKQYNEECRLGLELINQFERFQSIIPTPKDKEYSLLSVGVNSSELSTVGVDMSNQNLYVRELRYKYWNMLFNTKELSNLFTCDVRNRLYSDMQRFRSYDFTLANIKTLQLELSMRMTNNIEDAILKQFEQLSYQNSMGCSGNVHYYNGWKTNKAYMINKKVIIPCYDIYNRWGSWDIYRLRDKLEELEKIFIYLDAGKTEGPTFFDVYNKYCYGYGKDSTTWQGEKISFKYFEVEGKKKGTLHVWFKDMELLKKFNIFGANKKGWLPESYGKTSYKDMSAEEKAVVDDFQGEKEYNKVIKNREYYLQLQTSGTDLLKIGMTEE